MLVSDLGKSTRLPETKVAKIACGPFYILTALVVQRHENGLDSAARPMLQVLELVDPLIPTSHSVPGIDNIHQPIEEALADALTDVAWMNIYRKIEGEPTHGSPAGVVAEVDKADNGLTHIALQTFSLVAFANRNKAR